MDKAINSPLLKVKDLKTYFFTKEGIVKAVDGVSFSINSGEVLGIVGESGCGKSVTSLSILRLIDAPGETVSGEVFFDGKNLMQAKKSEMIDVRGNQISMIFQEPHNSLNPVFSVGNQIVEVFRIHEKANKKEAWRKAVDLLRLVGIPDPEQKANAYPHEMSGGQAQRVMIAMALALNPKLLIADEPTTALDVTIQAQILDLIRDLRSRMGTSVILITHDLGVVAEMADRIAVMYAGVIVEQADVEKLFENPLHPYSQGLIDAIPILGTVKDLLNTIPGAVPNLIDLPSGCRFAPRCTARQEYDLEICTEQEPDMIQLNAKQTVRCWLYQGYDGHRPPLNKEFVSHDGKTK